jgi:hypothetical protein
VTGCLSSCHDASRATQWQIRPPHRARASATRFSRLSNADRENVALRAGGDLSLRWRWRCRGWRDGGLDGRRHSLGLAPGFCASARGGCASGHGGLSACLQAVLAALAPASDLSFLLSHRVSPSLTIKSVRGAVSEAPKIVARGLAVNHSEGVVRLLCSGSPASHVVGRSRLVQRAALPSYQSLYVELSASLPGRDMRGFPALLL